MTAATEPFLIFHDSDDDKPLAKPLAKRSSSSSGWAQDNDSDDDKQCIKSSTSGGAQDDDSDDDKLLMKSSSRSSNNTNTNTKFQNKQDIVDFLNNFPTTAPGDEVTVNRVEWGRWVYTAEPKGDVARGFVRNTKGKQRKKQFDVAFPGCVGETYWYAACDVFAGREQALERAISCAEINKS